jgi:DNA-binding transcriptional MocR family regulator
VTIWKPELPEGTKARYAAIANALAADIAAGRLPEGERLPTHRELADVLGIAIGTVTRAYAGRSAAVSSAARWAAAPSSDPRPCTPPSPRAAAHREGPSST